jgi:hypothetical protein
MGLIVGVSLVPSTASVGDCHESTDDAGFAC